MPHTWPSVGVLYMVLIVYSAACLGAFVLALLFKLLQFYRHELLRHDNARQSFADVTHPDTGDYYGEHTPHHVYHRSRKRSETSPFQHGLLVLVQYFLGFCLVLIFISCNVPLCVCAVLGGTLGIFINRWKRKRRRPRIVDRQRTPWSD